MVLLDLTIGYVLSPLPALASSLLWGANTDNGFPVHQGTASLQNNNTHATSGLALGQRKLPDFIPSVHIMLATLLSFWLFSVFSPVHISVGEERLLDIYNFHRKLVFDNWKFDNSKYGPKLECYQCKCMSWKELKKKSHYVTLQHFCACEWKDETP